MKRSIQPSGRESPFGAEEIIVSKTDCTGRITYTNEIFRRVAHYTVAQILGQPHSIIRHPDMPRCVFKLLWDGIQARQEMFAYVLNMASNGDHYWVFAHVTPSFDAAGQLVGYHSNRRKPDADQIDRIAPLYASLLDEERRASDRKIGLQQSHATINAMLRDKGVGYDEFVFAL